MINFIQACIILLIRCSFQSRNFHSVSLLLALSDLEMIERKLINVFMMELLFLYN